MKHSILCGLVCLLLANPILAQSSYDKVLYLEPPLATSCLAVEIPTPEASSLLGLRWFHNDALVAFPKLVLLEGQPGAGPDLSEAALILLELVGTSLSWGEVNFGGPLTSSTGTAYAVFFFPEAVPTTGIGQGKGPGIGIKEQSGAPFYLSGDAQQWVRFDATYAIGIEPIYASGKLQPRVLAQMKAALEQERPKPAPNAKLLTQLLAPRPNPFNLRVEIAFTLAAPGPVRLVIYDLRGREITTLLKESLPQGSHSVIWEGRDAKGRELSSGSYFVRLHFAGTITQQRLVLLR